MPYCTAKLAFGRSGGGFSLSEGDTGTGQVIGGHFHGYAIPKQNTNIVFTHFPGKVCQNDMSIVQLDAELGARKCFNHYAFCSNFIFFFRHTSSFYSPSLVNERRLMRRIAFFFSIRRCSLFETNQRLRRTVLNTPLLTTFLRKRLSRESCDSPLRKFTTANEIHLLPNGRCRHKKPADMQTRPGRIARKRRNDIHDQGINGNASHSSFINLDTVVSMPGCKNIIHDSGADEKTTREFCYKKSPLEGGLYPTLARRVTLTPPSIWADILLEGLEN